MIIKRVLAGYVVEYQGRVVMAAILADAIKSVVEG
jgi:hypothetical protein